MSVKMVIVTRCKACGEAARYVHDTDGRPICEACGKPYEPVNPA